MNLLEKVSSEREELIKLLTDPEVGYNVFRFVKDFKKSDSPEFLYLANLMYLSLTSVAITNFNHDCFITRALMEEVDAVANKQNEKEALKSLEKREKESKSKYDYDLKVPKIMLDFKKGTLGFKNYLADKKITVKEIRELIQYIVDVLPDYIVK